MILLENYQFVLIIIAAVLLSLLILFIIIGIVKRNNIKKMKNGVYNLLREVATENEATIEIINMNGFDYKVEDKNRIIYIKLIPNFNNYEINVNNKTMWQIRKGPHDESLNMLDGIEEPMHAEFKNESKHVEKLFIIYPNARQLLIALNECEYAFISKDTNVYGAKLITYQDLVSLIEIEKHTTY